MPYIKQDDRDELDVVLAHLFEILRTKDIMSRAGSLNYVCTRLMQGSFADTKQNYSVFNTLVGILECCKLELYRRIVSPYEDQKIEENGDVV